MIAWLTDRLIDTASAIRTLRRDKRELGDNALRALSHALNETYIYHKDSLAAGTRNADIETQLVRYWSAAAIPLRHIDVELAEMCEHKATYWINPDGWSQWDIDRSGIGLSRVRKHYRNLLFGRNT